MKIIFAGTPDFAAKTLLGLLHKGIEISACYTQPDRKKGRGRELSPSPVKELASSKGISFYQPKSFKEQKDIDDLKQLKPDLIIVVAYGLILPEAVLNIPTHGCINVHGSILPRWRGAAPVQYALLSGDTETGITIFRLDKGVDTGDILTVRKCPILAKDTSSSILDKFVPLGVDGLVEVVGKIRSNEANFQKQDNKLATFAPKIEKSAGTIDWDKEDAAAICRKLRAFHPWPGTYLVINEDNKIKLLEANEIKGDDVEASYLKASAGTIVNISKQEILIKAKENFVAVHKLQFSGSKAITANDVKNSTKYLDILKPLMV